MNASAPNDPVAPWYKQFWLWFILVPPAAAVVAGTAMIFTAFEHQDPMVTDDYYKTGLAINLTLARDKQAAQLGLQAVGRINEDNRQVIITLYGQNSAKKLHLSLTHPTTSQQDISINLYADKNKKEFTGQLPDLPQEKRYILLEPEDKSWRLTGHAMFPDTLQWSLRPGL